MEIPDIHIKDIDIPAVYIPDSPITIPGCQYTHRDLKVTGNSDLLLADPNGVYATCTEGTWPTFYPMEWDRDMSITVQEPSVSNEDDDIPKPPKPKFNQTEAEIEEVIPCPDPNSNLRIGSFANEQRLERVSKFEVVDGDCLPVWEKVTYAETYFPSPGQAISTAGIAVIAASAPLLLNVIKPAVKNLIKKITGKKKSNDDEVKPD
jgi:hypothetical protein